MWPDTRSKADDQTPLSVSFPALHARGTTRLTGHVPKFGAEISASPNVRHFHVLKEVSAQDSVASLLFNALADAKILTSNVAMVLDDKWRRGFFAKLDRLHDIENWEEGNMPVQKASVHTLLRAMILWRPKKAAALGLSFRGNLIAAWQDELDSRLVIEFLPDDTVTYILTAPDGDIEGRHSGNGRSASLQKLLSPFPQVGWFDFA